MSLYELDHDISSSDSRGPAEQTPLLQLAALLRRVARLTAAEQGRLEALQRLQWSLVGADAAAAGGPPASAAAVAALETVEISGEESEACPVCTEELASGGPAKKMPCKGAHLFHEQCILPWVRRHNTCPVCRFELPTDDPVYEEQKKYRERRAVASSMYNEMYN